MYFTAYVPVVHFLLMELFSVALEVEMIVKVKFGTSHFLSHSSHGKLSGLLFVIGGNHKLHIFCKT